MDTSEEIKSKIRSYSLPLEQLNPPRISSDSIEDKKLIRPGEQIICIFGEQDSDITLEKATRCDSDFNAIYESVSKDQDLYIIEGLITIQDNDLYLTNIQIWDTYTKMEK